MSQIQRPEGYTSSLPPAKDQIVIQLSTGLVLCVAFSLSVELITFDSHIDLNYWEMFLPGKGIWMSIVHSLVCPLDP